MSFDHTSFLKNFQPVVASYQDVSAIYAKLFSQGQLQKIAGLLSEIYDEEHVFTLTELQKYCKDNNQKEDEFVSEQYELNSNIFRRNLTLIMQTLVDDLGKKFLERFRQDYSTGSNTEEVSFKNNQTTEQSMVSEKNQYRSNMPEIQEESEANKSPAVTKAMSLASELDHSNNRTFDLSINELNQRMQGQPQPQPQQQVPVQYVQKEIETHQNHQQTPKNKSQQQQQQQQYQQHQQQQQQKPQTPVNQRVVQSAQQERQERMERQERQEYQKQHASPYQNRNEVSGYTASEATRPDEYSQYENEAGTFRVSQMSNERNYFTPTPSKSSHNIHHWSSPERSVALGRKNMHAQSSAQRMNKLPSPTRVDRQNNSLALNTMSRWSTSNGRPDPSVLDSEFSYSQGKSFSKSPKKFHYDIQDVPGPGDYEVEEGVQKTMLQNPIPSFSKSPKVPSYFTKSKVPGAIYYPIKFFSSK